MEILLDIIRSVDYNILLLIADRLRGGVLDPVMTMLSLIGNGGAVWITLAVLLLFFRKRGAQAQPCCSRCSRDSL